MKNKIQKIFRMMLALVLLLTSMGINNVFAAENGSITVNGTTNGKSYGVYKIFDLTYEGDNVSYTIANEWKDFFKTGKGKDYIVSQNTGNLNPIVLDDQVKYININDNNIADFAKAAMAEMPNKTRQAVQTANGDTITFSNLSLGYYLVHPEGATELADGQVSIVSLTSTKPSGTVVVKGKYPTIKKVADKKSADYDEKITFTVTGKVPDSTGYSKYEYVLKDTLPKGLTIDKDSIKVTINGTVQTAHITKTVEGQNITVTFNILEIVKNNNVKAGQEIKVTYDTRVNKDFDLGNVGEENKAHVEFSNDPKDDTKKDKTPEEEVKVYSGKIKIVKYAKGNETTKLKGAEFVLKNSEGKYYKLEETNDKKKVTWVSEKGQATVLTSDNNGELEFKGLKAGIYKLKETKAPKGYNLLTQEETVELKDGSGNTGTEIKMEATSKIENSSGTELPKVGGAGTKLFSLIGGAVIIYAVLSLVRGKIKLQER